MTRIASVLIVVLLAVACSSNSNSSSSERVVPLLPQDGTDELRTSTCRSDQSYRAVFRETNPVDGEVFVELFHEVAARQQFVEASNGTRLLVLDDTAWTTEDGVWQEFPVVPVRPLRVPWVENFITGSELVSTFEPAGTTDTAGIDVQVFRPSLEQMAQTFVQRFEDSEYAGTSTFEYWIDQCDAVVFADVTLTFAGDSAGVAQQAGLPPTLRYTYSLYDVGADVGLIDPAAPPGTVERPSN